MDSTTDVRRRPSMASMIVWVLFCCVMWFWAIGGPFILLCAVVQMLLNPAWMNIQFGERPMQPEDLAIPIVFSAVGLAFVVLRLRGHIRFGERD